MAESKINVKMNWNGGSKGKGNVTAGYLDTNIAIPEALGGSGEGSDPKELLITSAASCYSMTLVAMLEAKQLPVVQFAMETEAANSNEEGLKIIHYPDVVLAATATEEETQSLHRAFEEADKRCAVGNMLKKAETQITIEGKVSVKSTEEV